MNFTIVINQVLALFIIIIIGTIIKRFKGLGKNTESWLSWFVFSITMPSLILSAIQSTSLQDSGFRVPLIMICISLVSYTLAIVVALLLPRKFSALKADRGTYQYLMIFANVGYMGYPVIEAALGKEAIFYAALFNIPFNLLAYSVGAYLISNNGNDRGKNPKFLKLILNPGVFAVIIAIFLAVTNLKLPAVAAQTFSTLGSMTTPLSMLLIGFFLADVELNHLFKNIRLYAISGFRMVFFPVIHLVILKSLGMEGYLLTIPVLLTSMPAAAVSVIMASQYQGNEQVASQGVFLSTLISIATIPIWAYILTRI